VDWVRAFLGRPRRPRVLQAESSTLGLLKWDELADFWTGSRRTADGEIAVWIDGEDCPNARSLSRAKALILSFDEFQSALAATLQDRSGLPRMAPWADEIRALKCRLLVVSDDAVIVWFRETPQSHHWKICYGDSGFSALTFER
jgi:hypothetical protein